MLFLCVVLLSVAILFGEAASATIISTNLAIDFRSADWAGAYGQSEYTVGNVTARPYDADNSSSWYAQLYQDNIDGLGVLGGEPDEIDSHEIMWVHIECGMMLNGVWITDLFAAPDGGNTGEEGEIHFLDTGGSLHTFHFYGNEADQGNGEIRVDFGGDFLVSDAWFVTYPWPDYKDNDFSVAGFTGTPVPEPATMLLLGVGLIGIAGFGRKKLLKKT